MGAENLLDLPIGGIQELSAELSLMADEADDVSSRIEAVPQDVGPVAAGTPTVNTPATTKEKGWGWLKDFPCDLTKLDAHGLADALGLEPGPLKANGDGTKFRVNCIAPDEHTGGVGGDCACIFQDQGQMPGYCCSHSGHKGVLKIKDFLLFAGADRVGQFAPPLAKEKLPMVSGGHLAAQRSGLCYYSHADDVPAIFLIGPHKVEAMVRDAHDQEWGIALSWKDPDGRDHREHIFHHQLAGDGTEVRAILASGGLRPSTNPKARGILQEYLNNVTVHRRARMVSKIGWTPSGAFVLPCETIGGEPDEEMIFQGHLQNNHTFQVAGTLEEWQLHVGLPCIGNSRLIAAVSAALAGPLLGPLQMESGGLHIKGHSSTGKSTRLFAAGSIWGGGDPIKGFVGSWRATSNGLEGTALGRNDSLLLLDELGEIDGAEAGKTAYMLANGQQKSRARSDGSPRTVNTWTIMFLSSGEQSLADKMGEAGHIVKVGQEIRLLEIPADAGCGLGMFEDLHGAKSGADFADAVRQAALSYYGTPCRVFLEALIAGRQQHLAYVGEVMERFRRRHTPEKADGQVQRVVRRFALVAAAGELGIKMGILPWPAGEAERGVGACFHAWLDERGGNGPAEIQKGVQQVLRFLQTQSNRFEDAWDTTSTFRAVNRAGFRRQVEDHWEYYVFNEVFKKEACKGFNSAQIAKALVEAGHMKGDGAKTSKTVNVPKHGRSRMYYFPALPVEREPITDDPSFRFDGELSVTGVTV